MVIAGWVFAVLGNTLFLAALVMTIRANADTRIPYYRNPVIIPKWSILMRGIGVGLIVLGAAALIQSLGRWSVVAVLAAPLISLLLIVAHNRQVGRRT